MQQHLNTVLVHSCSVPICVHFGAVVFLYLCCGLKSMTTTSTKSLKSI